MTVIRLTKSFTFEMAHALYNYDGKCKNIHGHSYSLYVVVFGQPLTETDHPADGLLIDFSELKQLVNKSVIDIFDHALVLKNGYQSDLNQALSENFERLIYVDYQPTCENLINDFASKITGALPGGVSLHHLALHETTTSFCEWYAEDQVS